MRCAPVIGLDQRLADGLPVEIVAMILIPRLATFGEAVDVEMIPAIVVNTGRMNTSPIGFLDGHILHVIADGGYGLSERIKYPSPGETPLCSFLQYGYPRGKNPAHSHAAGTDSSG